MNNNKIVPIKTTSVIFLVTILLVGTITSFPSLSFMVRADAQVQPSYYNSGMDNNYEKSSYQKDSSKSVISINKIKCINDNININGNNAGDVNAGNKKGQGYFGANSYDGGGYYDDGDGNNKQGKWFDCVINNNNTNTNINNQTIPPEPEPTIPATLTVKKQVFGCDEIFDVGGLIIDCRLLPNNSPEWLDCNTNPAISGSIFCQSLPESIFDIEVVDDQGNQIQEFVGSEQGTTIQNLEPGTYTVNEIEHLTNINQLGEDSTAEVFCTSAGPGFPDGGNLFNSTARVLYNIICFEYEDEQGNDCSTITLAAGEERTCIVKNYISLAQDLP